MANTSIDLVVTAVSVPTWIPLGASDAAGTSSFNSGGNWQDGNVPSGANGYTTRAFTLRSPADNNAYSFDGALLAIDTGGRFLLKGTNGQVITVPSLVINGGVVDFAVSTADNFTETLAGSIMLNGGLTNYLGAVGSAAAAETLVVEAPIGGGGHLQIGGPNVNGGADVGVVVLAATNTYTGGTTVATGTLLVNGANGTSAITVNANATLGGIGSLAGPVTVQPGGTLAPGIPSRGALTAALGTLSAGNTATLGGSVLMRIERGGTVTTSDRLAAPSIMVNPGAVLTVSNIGSTNLVAGDSFTLFSRPVSGSFTTLNLPALPDTSVAWTNQLAVNGTIAVIQVAVNTSSINITASVSGGSLSVSWPADHIGWTLQVQTNSLSIGLRTNWVDVPGSTGTNVISLPVDNSKGTVFYRLKL